jgi:hypothetical protein
MAQYDTQSLTQAVIERLGDCNDARFKQVMTSLVQHLHDFARDVDLKPQEWINAIQFLTDTGKACNDKRQEFILLSDTLGLSMLVVALEQARGAKGRKGATPATEATVQGPFYWPGAPERRLGDDLAEGVSGEPALYTGRVTDPRASRCPAPCSTCGRAMATACTTCRWPMPACARAAGCTPTSRGATGSGRSGPRTIRCPPMARSARCWAGWAATRTARAIST